MFDFSGGDRSFTFTLEQGQTPDRVSTGIATRIFFNDVEGTFVGVDGSSSIASSVSSTNAFNRITVNAAGFGRSFFGGPNLFDGSTTNPMVNLRTFALTQVSTGPGTGGGTLTISQLQVGAVPEPSTWAMMILGFGFVAGAMRSQRRRTSESLAAA